MLIGILRGHAVICISGDNPVDKFTILKITRHNGTFAGLEFHPRTGFLVQSQSPFSLLGIDPVALVAGIGQDGPDITVKTNGRGWGWGSACSQ